MSAIYLLGCLLFIFLQGFFASSEIAFVSSSILKLRHRKDQNKNSLLAYQLRTKPEGFLATTLVGTNISVVVSSSLATYFLISLGVSNSNLWITFLFWILYMTQSRV